MRRQSEYTLRLCRPYKASKHSASPCLARSIASCSEIPLAKIFLAVVKLVYSVSCPVRCKDGGTSLPDTGGDRVSEHCPSFVSKRTRAVVVDHFPVCRPTVRTLDHQFPQVGLYKALQFTG